MSRLVRPDSHGDFLVDALHKTQESDSLFSLLFYTTTVSSLQQNHSDVSSPEFAKTEAKQDIKRHHPTSELSQPVPLPSPVSLSLCVCVSSYLDSTHPLLSQNVYQSTVL